MFMRSEHGLNLYDYWDCSINSKHLYCVFFLHFIIFFIHVNEHTDGSAQN